MKNPVIKTKRQVVLGVLMSLVLLTLVVPTQAYSKTTLEDVCRTGERVISNSRYEVRSQPKFHADGDEHFRLKAVCDRKTGRARSLTYSWSWYKGDWYMLNTAGGYKCLDHKVIPLAISRRRYLVYSIQLSNDCSLEGMAPSSTLILLDMSTGKRHVLRDEPAFKDMPRYAVGKRAVTDRGQVLYFLSAPRKEYMKHEGAGGSMVIYFDGRSSHQIANYAQDGIDKSLLPLKGIDPSKDGKPWTTLIPQDTKLSASRSGNATRLEWKFNGVTQAVAKKRALGPLPCNMKREPTSYWDPDVVVWAVGNGYSYCTSSRQVQQIVPGSCTSGKDLLAQLLFNADTSKFSYLCWGDKSVRKIIKTNVDIAGNGISSTSSVSRRCRLWQNSSGSIDCREAKGNFE